ncbi:HhoA/HhoB/HtrA family serine endopeptidase [Aphanothece sacrum]|uniref:HtrA2 peptidase n=1 Tax=Aphanothece sacrum FPU1 TaxID=1920663 RepID=A0A401IMS3_APHSA|nr:HhoA/HhoB/HtrA family serine endopeptidase [Aphanothece sacrum]GBF82543.1 HtrA2 peptidase [Aphanothece sacrum FPU1]GBF84677.1 HtrA2 peptidase [Aphanothece sacrum FPU3]
MKDNQINMNNTQSKGKQYLTSLSLVIFGIGIGVGGIYAINFPQLITENIKNLTQSQPANAQSELALAPPTDSGNFVTDVVNKVGPAVVRINASRTVKTEDPSISNDPFFGSQIPEIPNSQIQRGTGSGFIVSNDGKILTNAHVVDGADQVTVTLKDGRTLIGKVLGEDRVTDVAVIKIEADNLPTIKMGNSDKLQVGEWAIAIGNPLGLDNTVTTGIISATGRLSSQVGVGDKRVEFLQTDAAINPGNSGGPLLNSLGEVIGMNTAIIKDAQGIGFAIPINKAQQISQQLISTGKAEHPYLGIQMVGITPEIKQELQQTKGLTIQADTGILIMNVAPNSPADQAGLKPGDVLQEIDQKPLKDPGTVQQAVEKTSIGQTLPLQVERDGQSLTLEVKVGVLPAN